MSKKNFMTQSEKKHWFEQTTTLFWILVHYLYEAAFILKMSQQGTSLLTNSNQCDGRCIEFKHAGVLLYHSVCSCCWTAEGVPINSGHLVPFFADRHSCPLPPTTQSALIILSHLLSSCCAQACFSGAHQSTVGWDRHETLSQALRSVFCSSKTSISPSSLRQASRRFILLKRNPPWRWCVVCHIQVKQNNVTMFILRRCMEKFNWDSRTQQSTCPSPSVISSSKNYVCPFPLITQDVGT